MLDRATMVKGGERGMGAGGGGLIFYIIVSAASRRATTNGILLYAMKKSNDSERQFEIANRTEERPGAMNFTCLMVISSPRLAGVYHYYTARSARR